MSVFAKIFWACLIFIATNLSIGLVVYLFSPDTLSGLTKDVLTTLTVAISSWLTLKVVNKKLVVKNSESKYLIITLILLNLVGNRMLSYQNKFFDFNLTFLLIDSVLIWILAKITLKTLAESQLNSSVSNDSLGIKN